MCYVATGETKTSGTGRNTRVTRIVAPFDIWSALPVDQIRLHRASGKRIEPTGEGPFQSLFRKYKEYLTYSATIEWPSSQSLAKVVGTQRVVASAVTTKDGGLLAVMPSTLFSPVSNDEGDGDEGDDEDEGEYEDGEIWPDEAIQYQIDLIAAVEQSLGNTEVTRPEWAARFSTAEKGMLAEKVISQERAIEEARDVLSRLKAQVDAVELEEQLYLGTGRMLELRVKDVFEKLGGVLVEPEPGRDDWRVDFDGRPAVVEIKGTTKSAAEKHAAQLEKWVAGAFEESGVMPKGILIVNTWRETPLDQRDQDDFPAQMLPYSEGRGHCLATGLDLFVIAREIDADPSKTQLWREKILATNGRLTGVPEWQTVLTESRTTSRREDDEA